MVDVPKDSWCFAGFGIDMGSSSVWEYSAHSHSYFYTPLLFGAQLEIVPAMPYYLQSKERSFIMPQTMPLTKSAHDHILEQANHAFSQGNDDEAFQLMKRLPLPKHLAKAATELFGENYLQSSGFIVEEVEYADLPD